MEKIKKFLKKNYVRGIHSSDESNKFMIFFYYYLSYDENIKMSRNVPSLIRELPHKIF